MVLSVWYCVYGIVCMVLSLIGMFVWYCLYGIVLITLTGLRRPCLHSLCLDPSRYRKRRNVLSTSMHALVHCSLVLIGHAIWPALLLWLLCHDGLESGTANQINPFPFKLLLLWCFTTVTEKKLRQYPKLVEGLGIGKGYCNLRSFSSNSGLLRSLNRWKYPPVPVQKCQGRVPSLCLVAPLYPRLSAVIWGWLSANRDRAWTERSLINGGALETSNFQSMPCDRDPGRLVQWSIKEWKWRDTWGYLLGPQGAWVWF